jgi:PadR family transcriptional regulator, regulatory protein PadR
MTERPSHVDLLQGTLDLLILRSLVFGQAHGHAIAQHIRQSSEAVLQVETGSLYPALHRAEARGWVIAEWALSDKGKRAKYYRLTPAGRRQLVTWEQVSMAIGRVLRAERQESR